MTESLPHHPGQRIAKAMARAGLCSRREAEAWILAGRVSVNGQTLASPAFNVVDGDDVRVDGQPMQARERTRMFLFHKPRGLVTTARDPEGRPTIFDALPKDLPRVVAIGRLDINTEGLLLLTNDGGLARVLELPATGRLRRYRVRAHGTIDQAALDGLSDGVTIDGVSYAGIDAKLERLQGSNVWLSMGLREGKNREIKRVLEHLGLSVNRLIRIAFGPFELADLGEGEVIEARTRVLRDQLGPRLMREAEVDFDAPLIDHDQPPPPTAEPMRRPRRSRDEAETPPPRREPPRSAGPERKRKHVAAIRAAAAAAAAGPRKRIERSATSDRKGRVVEVERVLPTREEQRRREQARLMAEARRDGRSSRPGRPFAPRAGASDQSRDRGEGGERPARRPWASSDQPRAAGRGDESAPRQDQARRGAKPFPPRDRAEGRGPRAARPFEPRNRGDGDERPARRSGGFDPARAADRSGKEARAREDASSRAGRPFPPRDRAEGRGPRPAKPFEAREDRGSRPPRPGKPFGKRPSGGAGRGGPRSDRPGGQRPPRRP